MDDGDRGISTKKPYRTFSTAPVCSCGDITRRGPSCVPGRAGVAAWS